MTGLISGSFQIDIREFDTLLLPRLWRLPDNAGFSAALNGIVRKVLESEGGGTAGVTYLQGEKLANVRYTSSMSLEEVKDRILRLWNGGPRDDRTENLSGFYERLEVLRFGIGDDVGVSQALVEICLARRDRVLGAKHFGDLKRQTGETASTLILQGRLQLLIGSRKNAMSSFRKAFNSDPTNVESGRRLLDMMVRMGTEFVQVRKLVVNVLERDPENSAALFAQAMLRFEDRLDRDGETILRTIWHLNDTPPIEEFAWKAWVELNKRFSARIEAEVNDLLLPRTLYYVNRLFSPLNTMDVDRLHGLVWKLFKEDLHSWDPGDQNRTIRVDALNEDAPLAGVLAILWIACSLLIPGHDIGFKQLKQIELLHGIELRPHPVADRKVFHLITHV